jgi:hypothetical protein
MSEHQMSNISTAQSMTKQLARRRLALPALLFLTALQPLYFVAGHLLLVTAPVADLLGLDMVATWGTTERSGRHRGVAATPGAGADEA